MAQQAVDIVWQINMQAPTNANVASVVKQVQSQFKNANIGLNVNVQSLAQANKTISQTSKSAKQAAKDVNIFGKSLAGAARRFGGFAVGTQIFGKLTSSISGGVKEAIKFEREMVKISQITGKTVKELGGLQKTVTNLSRSLGASSSALIEVTKTLTQAGFTAQQTQQALKVLADTSLGASFNSITDTTEGAIAILRQFSKQAKATGDQTKFLTDSLDAINSVSKKFAVESSDIIAAVRRVGGVFATAGGEVNELIALFTSIRATTRESAETIAVGLRTIFTRIQRTDTVDQLKNLGIELRNAEGQFVGVFEAIKRLSAGLSTLDPKDFRFSEIVEELGGIRQVGKIIPLIQQFTVAEQALAVANTAVGSTAADAVTAQQSLSVQFQKTQENVAALFRTIADSEGFKELVQLTLSATNALVKLGETLTPLIPTITKFVGAFAAIGAAKLVGGAAKGILGKNSGGKIHKFARGGFVPGSGNSDTVPAMLTPGEFVIKKSSAASLGASTLEAMNNNRFNEGVRVRDEFKARSKSGLTKISPEAVLKASGDRTPGDGDLSLGGAFLQPGQVRNFSATLGSVENPTSLKQDVLAAAGISKIAGQKGQFATSDKEIDEILGNTARAIDINIQSGSLTASQSSDFQSQLQSSIEGFASLFAGSIGMPFDKNKFSSAYQSANIEQIEGNIFEATISGMSDKPFDNAKINANDTLDFPFGLGNTATAFGLPSDLPSDSKRTFSEESLESLSKKGYNTLVEGLAISLSQGLSGEFKGKQRTVGGTTGKAAQAKLLSSGKSGAAPLRRHFGGPIQKFANGGNVGTDTVPALLTPGEYVINKSAAQSIGYSNLNSMNQTGVAKFAKGGPVGVQKFANGGLAAAAEKQQSLSGTIQNIALMGSIAGTTAISMSSLSDEAKETATRITAMLGGILAVGSSLQDFTNGLVKSTFAENADTQATQQNTAAVKSNTSAQTSGVKLLQGFNAGITAAMASAAILSIAFELMAQSSRQAAKKYTEAADKALEAARGGQGGGNLGDLRVLQTQAKGESAARDKAATAGIVGAIATGLPVALAGVASGALTFGAGAAAGTAAGVAGGAATYAAEYERVYAQEMAALEMATKDLRDFSSATVTALNSVASLDRKLSEIAEFNVLPQNATEQDRQDSARRIAQQQFNAVQATRVDVGAAERAGLDVGSRRGRTQYNEADKATLAAGEEALKELAAQAESLRQQAGSNLNAALQSDLAAGVKGDDLTRGNTLTAQALKDLRLKIQDEAKVRIAALKAQKESTSIASERQKIDEQIVAVNKEATESYRRARDSVQQASEVAERLAAAEERRLAIETYYKNLEASLNSFDNAVKASTEALGEMSNNMDSFFAAASGQAFKAAINVPAGLKDITEIGDINKFTNQAQAIGGQFGPGGQQIAQQAVNLATAFKTAEDNLVGTKISEPGQAFRPDLILEQLNLGEAQVPPQIYQQLVDNLSESFGKGETVTKEALQSALGPATEYGQAFADRLQALGENLNQQLALRQKYAQQLQQVMDQEIAARVGVVDAEERAASFSAQARGGELTSAQREDFRTRRAQEALGGVGKAGDIGGLDQTRRQAQARLFELQQQQAGGGVVDPGELQKLSNTVQKTTAEIQRLGDQSERAADIQKDIDAERKKRGAVEGIAEDFVFGGGDARRSINAGLAGVQAAMATGTVQNQSEEQRQATLSTLDRLQDIPVFKQLKENIIKNDAARLGIPPEIAQALFNPTSEEQKLIAKMDELGATQIQAAKTEAAFRADLTKQVVQSEDLLKQSIDALNTTIQQTLGGVDRAAGQVPQGMAYGGSVRGPGTGRSDSIPAMLSNGEYVVNAEQAQKNRGLLEAINSGQDARFASTGGSVPDGAALALQPDNPVKQAYNDEMRRRREQYQKEMKWRRDNSAAILAGNPGAMTPRPSSGGITNAAQRAAGGGQNQMNMNGGTLNVNLNLSGNITVSGINGQAIANAITGEVKNFVVATVKQMMSGGNTGFTAGG